MTNELWTVARIADYFQVSPKRAANLMAENGIGRVCGYPADQVRAIHRPGQGARVDLKEQKSS